MSKKIEQTGDTSKYMEFSRTPCFYDNSFWRTMAHLIWVGLLVLGFAILMIIGALLQENFLTLANMKVILSHLLTVGLMASVMVIIFSNGGLDLSVGSVLALVGTIVATLLQQGAHPANAIFLGLSLAFLVGLINGTLVGIARIPGILITFAMMFLVRGITYSFSGTTPIAFDSDSLLLSALNTAGWIVLVIAGLVAAFMVQFPVFSGKLTIPSSLKLSAWFLRGGYLGLPYVFSSLLAGFVGLVQASRLKAGIPTPDIGFEVQVILAVVLGGTCLGCRFGNVIGALVGTLFIAALQNLLALMDVSLFYQQFIVGTLFLFGTGLCYGYNAIVGTLYRKQSQSES
jgi:ribose/xylose/arabinose/galactoside ABC-type transport system permease subunit